MNLLPLDKPAGVLVKTTLVDFPGRVAGSFFLRGCNLRCPYCYNTGLILNNELDESLTTISELFEYLEKRRNVLSGLVISGGEPLINPYTPLIIKKAKELDYKIKLDTNGTLPDELEVFLTSKELIPDFIAMDFKTSPERYASTVCNKISSYYGNTEYFVEKIKKSINLVKQFSPDVREWRTVLVPELVSKDDIKRMAELLPEDASWQFAQFKNENCLDPSYNNIAPYIDSEINELIDYAKTFIKGAVLR